MKTLIRIGCVAFFLILTLSAHPALAATIHVPADQPTIQAGIDAAVDGDLVLVGPTGTYVRYGAIGIPFSVVARELLWFLNKNSSSLGPG